MYKLCLSALLVSVSPLLGAGALRWSDEFNLPAGSRPSSEHWVYDLGNSNGWGNSELQHYTDDLANASIIDDPEAVDGKALAITALKAPDGRYTSARLKTKGKREFTHGRIEARLRLPKGQGIWPAFWMLGANIDTVGWPACGEIDVLEVLGHEPQRLYGTLHGPGYFAAAGKGTKTDLTGGATFADAYHVVAVEWFPEVVKWYVDGRQYHEVKITDVPEGKWVFKDAPQFLLLNLAVGGGWPGNPDQTTVFPQTYRIDYVRVYDLAR